ncbi:bifunctional diaminohydroxyphosphoribosylaminopyrimidine deaminase/5-amino-6-(5-phosphoribosylamino)uracil reductase RibD [Leucothrix arctica]|uniref:Riboflavin biosynthesis protein RibD n=2 Tax=Leucothrix arctica TaxID=1481894 RepID=A0A317C5S5_9GAMM|nr:bifunctional diaminohydroxyphosphoribosylaminopyrimidine deaminase/5-amino-6-(5-phosphoribosylamino)uracil reductase RibD [Leucothrix arctica]
MVRAIQLAKRGQYTTHPNPRVGCAIVKNGNVIAEGYHRRAGQPHAEIDALQNLSESPVGATAYVTLEPCSHTGRTPPCSDALVKAGVSEVVIAMQDPNPRVAGRGIKRLKDAGIKVTSGVLEAESRALNPGFIKRMEQGLPFVRVKMATSLDGRTALASGESKWITGESARKDVQFYRAKCDAILTGIGTVLADDPSLTVRLTAIELDIEGEVRQPTRVILDTQLRCPPSAKILSLSGKTLIYTAVSGSAVMIDEATNKTTIDKAASVTADKISALVQAGAEVVVVEKDANGTISLVEVLKDLANREINEVHTEAGSKLCGNLLEAGLADELLLYMAPHLLGSDAMGAFNLPNLTTMQQRINLKIQDIRAIGDDWRIIAALEQTQV